MNLLKASLCLVSITLVAPFDIIWDDDTYALKTVQSMDENGDNLLTRQEMSLKKDARKWANITMMLGDVDKNGYMDYKEFTAWFTKAGDQASVQRYLQLYGSS